MKKFLYIAAAAIAALSSCTKAEIEAPEVAKAPVFTATIEGDADTKTTLANGTKVNWEDTDKVSINGATYAVTPGASKATLAYESGTAPTSPYKAYYPASMYSAGTATLPASYAYTEGKFNMPMYAENSGTSLEFKNLCGVLAITVPSTQMNSVTSITVSSDKQMNGAFTATDAGVLSFAEKTLEAADKKVTLTFSEAKTISSSETFYIPVPAGTHNPLTITVTNGSIVKVMKTKKSGGVSVERSKIYPITFGHNGDSNILCGLFSVAADKKVQFTKGNLYWNGSAWGLEADQISCPTTWKTDHVGHFYWSKTAEVAYAETYSDDSRSASDNFFCDENHKMTVDGSSDLFALSQSEWSYLISRSGGSLVKYPVTVGGKTYCFIIAPDGYANSTKPLSSTDTYTLEEVESLGLVCLRPDGKREGSNLTGGLSKGNYWSSTPSGGTNGFVLTFDSSNNSFSVGAASTRSYGRCLRLVTLLQ